jgi:hypothetical protein
MSRASPSRASPVTPPSHDQSPDPEDLRGKDSAISRLPSTASEGLSESRRRKVDRAWTSDKSRSCETSGCYSPDVRDPGSRPRCSDRLCLPELSSGWFVPAAPVALDAPSWRKGSGARPRGSQTRRSSSESPGPSPRPRVAAPIAVDDSAGIPRLQRETPDRNHWISGTSARTRLTKTSGSGI